LIRSTDFDTIILGTSERGFGFKKEIHIWITQHDYETANLMILLAYIMLGHRDWHGGQIKIFAIYPESELASEKQRLSILIQTGRLPISSSNIQVLSKVDGADVKQTVNEKSYDADLTMVGLNAELLKNKGKAIFDGYEGIGNILFIHSSEQKEIR